MVRSRGSKKTSIGLAMVSGTMWRSAVAANAVYCSACTATPPSRRSSDCNCKTQLESVQLLAHDPGLAVSYGPAGDEEHRDLAIFGAMLSVEEVEEASSDLQNVFRLSITGYLTPPLPGSDEMAPSSAVLQVIHEFQHNPEAWDIVKSLANDKRIWDAVMANEKIIAFCRKFIASEGTTSEGAANGAKEEKAEGPRKSASFFSQLYWITKQGLVNFIARFQKFMAGLFDEEGPGMSDHDGKSSFFDRVVRGLTRLAVLILSLVTFKRAADYSSKIDAAGGLQFFQ